MSRTSRYAYILAKVYGIMARSFVGQNYRDLLRLKKLTELYDRLYPGERGELPEQRLPVELEARITRASIRAMTDVLETLDEPVEILVHALRKIEYQNVKTALRGIAGGRAGEGRIWDLGPYAGVRLVDAKDPEKALGSSPYKWVLPLLRSEPLAQIENRLDRDYFARLLDLAKDLPTRDGEGIVRLATREIALADVVWALRLRFFFRMDAEAARGLLIPGLGQAHRLAVARAFEIPADAVEEWRHWKYGWLLEDQAAESFAAPDPLRAEQKAAQALYMRAHQSFHQSPFSLSPLFAYFKLKELEATMLRTAVEALNLSVGEQDVIALVGAP